MQNFVYKTEFTKVYEDFKDEILTQQDKSFSRFSKERR